MMSDAEKDVLIRELHFALDEVLALFVLGHGTDYHAVDQALAALAKSRAALGLPVTLALAEIIQQKAGVKMLEKSGQEHV